MARNCLGAVYNNGDEFLDLEHALLSRPSVKHSNTIMHYISRKENELSQFKWQVQ